MATPTSKPPRPPKTTTSGIQTTTSGERIIPATLRADGTTRPQRKVREGYTPAEDVVKYQNRAMKDAQTRGKVIPGAEEVGGATTQKKRRRKKKAAGGEEGEGEGEGDEGEEEAEGAAEAKADGKGEVKKEVAPAQDTEAAEAAAKEKKIKAIQKKIRQAEELKQRKDNGDKLLPEQLEKALKLKELIKDLEKLGVTQDS